MIHHGRETRHMPLDRDHVTRASRIMLPTYAAFFGILGTIYLAAPLAKLTASPGLAYADHLLSLRWWGALFLAAAVTMVAALVRRRREWFVAALFLCGLSMAVFSAAQVAAVTVGGASPGSPFWPGFVTAACVASYRSLTAREVQR